MSRKWITDVIEDLSNFAQQNFMPKLAAQLDFAHAIAREEIMEHRIAHEEAQYGNTSRSEALAEPVQTIIKPQHIESGSKSVGVPEFDDEKQHPEYALSV